MAFVGSFMAHSPLFRPWFAYGAETALPPQFPTI
jgi:hypothetical protein